ncbi:glycogen debranching protein [Rubrobacter tropicus]|uniref:Glycogen debranching protein n=1 Tax=Rubrobacter tropicus TaxID=2653851 RepID=A0A6G8Q8D5_9ACTN|nr:glycogen debranching protein [Rubrobacter tropicus]QIN82731.1 glycogen debranching protein [Rubrobacter tropicus]
MQEEEVPQTVSKPPGRPGFHDVNPQAAGVLQRNGVKSWTKPAPSLYPHQWSWDSAFIALGLAHVDNRRATGELEALFSAQWKTGKVPHIVFDPEAPPKSYFPDAERWNSNGLSEHAPTGPHTSGLCQPPVHALAVRRIWETAQDKDERGVEAAREFLTGNYPRLYSWHRYLSTARDPERSGLVTIYHPWESGTDNSPRWDAPLSRIAIGDIPSYTRYDVQHVADASHRPTDEEYDRFLWLLEMLKKARYEEMDIYGSHPFLVKDVLFSAILVAANEALLEIGAVVGAPAEERAQVEAWIERGREGLEEQWDPALNLCVDRDVLTGESLRVRTVAGFAPLISGGLDERRLKDMLLTLDSEDFAGNPTLHRPLPPSTSPDEPGFHPRSYWRGPVWPVANWLLWWSLLRAGESERAASLRHHTLEELAESGFAEYFEPFTGEPLGSGEQSWTAAIALDMLATENGP